MPKLTATIITIPIIQYFIFFKFKSVSIENFLDFSCKYTNRSWMNPTGHIHPQKNLLVSKIRIINKPIRRNGKSPWMNEKIIYSKIPVPDDKASLGDCKKGKISCPSLKIDKSIEKINSNTMKLIKKILAI